MLLTKYQAYQIIYAILS